MFFFFCRSYSSVHYYIFTFTRVCACVGPCGSVSFPAGHGHTAQTVPRPSQEMKMSLNQLSVFFWGSGEGPKKPFRLSNALKSEL